MVSVRTLSFPSWFPEPVKCIAQQQHEHAIKSGTSELVELVERLVTNPRMERVWMELSKRRRKGPSPRPFLHGLNGGNEAAQYSAMSFLFKEAVSIGRFCIASTESAQMERGYYTNRIMPLALDARRLKRFAHPTVRIERIVRDLLNAASAYRELDTLAAADTLFDRRRFESDKMVAIEFVTNLARVTYVNFGEVMHGQIATIASVVLNRKITRDAVVGWCEGQFGQV
jgi:hypothetical protein